MKIGICTSVPEQWITAARMGYDFIEGNLSVLVGATEEAFDACLKAQKESGIFVESCNCFFPGSFKLYSNPGDPESQKERRKALLSYLEIGFSRAKQLGCRVVVIGSSAVRSIPEGMDRQIAEEQFASALFCIAETAKAYGITVTVEPLNPRETNLINTLAESLAMIERVGHENLKAMTDYYHFAIQNEPYETILRAGERLVHLHLCRADRDLPRRGDLDAELAPFLAAALRAGFRGRVSLEGHTNPDFETAARAAISELMPIKAM